MRAPSLIACLACLACLLLAATGGPASSGDRERIDELQARVDALETRLDDLEGRGLLDAKAELLREQAKGLSIADAYYKLTGQTLRGVPLAPIGGAVNPNADPEDQTKRRKPVEYFAKPDDLGDIRASDLARGEKERCNSWMINRILHRC